MNVARTAMGVGKRPCRRAGPPSIATTTLDTFAHLWPTAEDRTCTAAAALMVEADKAADSLRTEAAETGS